jgi:nucleotide-binding universal stress UspA family protein
MYQIKRIAVAVDFKEVSLNAVSKAIQLANVFGASLAIIHAVSPSASKNKKAEFVSEAYTRLKDLQQTLMADHNNSLTIFSRVGEVDDFLYEYCLKNHTDLLVIGKETGERKIFSESKAYQIIMKVECPVLSIPAQLEGVYFTKILFPVRGVIGVKEKLLYSMPYLHKMGSILHMMIFGLPKAEQIRDVAEIANKEDIFFEPPDWDQLSEKDIPGQILRCASKVNAGLIVINATSEKEWYRLLGENYTESLLRASSVPLLSITHRYQSISD